jgi:hypothetical protein
MSKGGYPQFTSAAGLLWVPCWHWPLALAVVYLLWPDDALSTGICNEALSPRRMGELTHFKMAGYVLEKNFIP